MKYLRFILVHSTFLPTFLSIFLWWLFLKTLCLFCYQISGNHEVTLIKSACHVEQWSKGPMVLRRHAWNYWSVNSMYHLWSKLCHFYSIENSRKLTLFYCIFLTPISTMPSAIGWDRMSSMERSGMMALFG